MAYVQSMSPQAVHNRYRDLQPIPTTPPQQRRHATKLRFFTDLSQCLFEFVIQLLPTAEEMAIKEDVRKLLERLIRTIEPDSRLLSFGSTANGFSLRNSDMDLCCLIDSNDRLAASDLVTMLGDLLERETKFHVKPLPHARIPIVKLSLDPSPGLPLGIACDIGFENRLALENTRLLMCYAMIDPTRVRTMVLFLKVWSKRRKINSPYKGTLSSYGYVLLVIYFLVHVKNPPVLPNLQQMPPLRPISQEDTHLNGHNIWFFDDIDLLRQRWHSENQDTVAELLVDFFRYFSRDFLYNTGVASIRGGLLKKESKGWQNDLSSGRYNDARERNRFCIEDPFETDYNVARCVTKDGLYTIRGEFMRASRVLATRPERAIVALAELCEERKEEDLVSAPTHSNRPSIPPQTPYSVGSQSMRPKGAASMQERLSPPTRFFEPGGRSNIPPQEQHQIPRQPPPEHMAPKRSKWTSPPPAEASSADHTLFESKLGHSLELATSSTAARERERDSAYQSSSSNSEVFTDDDRASDIAESDDVTSVRSFTEGTTTSQNIPMQRRPSWHIREAAVRVAQAHVAGASNRNRYHRINDTAPVSFRTPHEISSPTPLTESLRRSLSRSQGSRPTSWSSNHSVTPTFGSSANPPTRSDSFDQSSAESSTVYYQTTVPRSPHPAVLYPSPGLHSSFLSQYHIHQAYNNMNMNNVIPPDIYSPTMSPTMMGINGQTQGDLVNGEDYSRRPLGPDTPTPSSTPHSPRPTSHGHSLSTTTITSPTPPAHMSSFAQANTSHIPQQVQPQHQHQSSHRGLRSTPARLTPSRQASGHLPSNAHLQGGPFVITPSTSDSTVTPSNSNLARGHAADRDSPQPSSVASNSSSPSPSSTGYATSISRSPSPHSPSESDPVSPGLSPPATALPLSIQARQKASSPNSNSFGFDQAQIHDGSVEEGQEGSEVSLSEALEGVSITNHRTSGRR